MGWGRTYLWKDVLDAVDGPHALRVGKRNVVGTDSDDGAVVLVGPDVFQVHLLVPDGPKLPQVGETCQKGAGDGTQALPVLNHRQVGE